MPHFECGAFDHSATSPDMLVGAFSATRFIAAVFGDGNLTTEIVLTVVLEREWPPRAVHLSAISLRFAREDAQAAARRKILLV
jgi:hypothetical protein